MKMKNLFKGMAKILPLFLTLLVFIACNKKEVMEPQKIEFRAFTDPIPYDVLGSGTIVFERIGPYPGEYEGCYIIDIDNQKTWAFDFGLATGYYVSPDGEKIAFTMHSGKNAYDVYMINIDGTNLIRLDAIKGQDRYPCRVPDGTNVLFWVEGVNPTTLYMKSATPIELIGQFISHNILLNLIAVAFCFSNFEARIKLFDHSKSVIRNAAAS